MRLFLILPGVAALRDVSRAVALAVGVAYVAWGWPDSRCVTRAMLPRELQDTCARDGFLFCPTPSCPLAYFGTDGSSYVHGDELRVRVGRKMSGPAATVCYCLRVTEGRIVEEVVAKRCCHTLDEVAEATGALLGKACHIVNPAGQCCGAEVKAVIHKALLLAGFAQDSPEVRDLLTEDVDHCRTRFGLSEPTDGSARDRDGDGTRTREPASPQHRASRQT